MKSEQKMDIESQLITITQQLLIESGELHKKNIRLDSSLQRHLGIDSLGRAELFQRIEKKFKVSMPDKLLASAETLQDIANYLSSAKPHMQSFAKSSVIHNHGERANVDPSQAESLTDIVLLYGESAPDKPHIYFQNEDGQEEIISSGDLLKNSLRIAQGLRDLGLQEGETVAIMQPTQPGFFYTFFGTLFAGGVPVPIYPPFRAHLLESYAKTEARILNNAQVRILVTFEQAENLSRLLQGFVPSLKHVTTVENLIQPRALQKFYHPKEDNFAFIQYTSGSTSDPKGVLLTHANLLANIRAYGKAVQIKSDDVGVSWLPLYHDMGLIGMWLGSLYHGIPLILLTPFSFLNHPERWLWAIHHHRGTHSGAPNFAYELCIRKIEPSMIEGLDLSSWRVAANGAEKVYPRTLEAFTKKFAPYGFKASTLMPVYGLAESTVGLAIPPMGRDFRIDKIDRKKFEEEKQAILSKDKNALEFAGCGMAIEGHELRIVDDNQKVLPERYVGNLQFRGPSTMQGYYNNPTATAAVLHEGGWIDSGDLAYLADDELFITGRRKDLIIKAGRNLYPAEIEEIVGQIADVRQGCVTAFAVSDADRSTEQLIVVAETRERDKSKRQQIIDHITAAMSSSLDIVPDHIVLVAPHTVPKTSSGKLQRAACKKMYLDGHLGKRGLPPWLQIGKLGSVWMARKAFSMLTYSGKFIYTAYMAAVILITFLPVWVTIHIASRATSAAICRAYARFLLFAGLCPLKKMGFEHLQQASPVIFAVNHASYIDSVVMIALAPPDTRFVGKKELLTTPILRTFMEKLNYLPVDRMDLSKGLEDTKHIEHALQSGHPILIFPEGTFSYAAGLRPFRLGAFKIAAETNTPICPIALQGTRSILREGNIKRC